MAILSHEPEILVVIEGEDPFTFSNDEFSMEIDDNLTNINPLPTIIVNSPKTEVQENNCHSIKP